MMTFCLIPIIFLCLSFFSASGSEEGAVFPPIPWGVFAPGRVCLHGGHVALPLRLHHHVHSAPQVWRKSPPWFCLSMHLGFNPSLHVLPWFLKLQPLISLHHLDIQADAYVISLFPALLPSCLFLTLLSQILSWLWCESDALGWHKVLQPVWLRGYKNIYTNVCMCSCVLDSYSRAICV